MTIVVVPSQPHGTIGPGLPVVVDSSVGLVGVSPFTFVLEVFPRGLLNPQTWTETFTATDKHQELVVGTQVLQRHNGLEEGQMFGSDDQVDMRVILRDKNQAFVDSSATVPAIWDATQGLGLQAHELAKNQTPLTDEQATQIKETWESTAQVIAVDSTIPVIFGPSAPGGSISARMPIPIFGLIVRILGFPPGVEATTPDGSYFVKDLAVARIFRGSDLWMRVPIHMPTKMIPLFSDVITAALTTVTATTWLIDMSYQVDFADGAFGEVIEMRLP